jgi:hypothetical protein
LFLVVRIWTDGRTDGLCIAGAHYGDAPGTKAPPTHRSEYIAVDNIIQLNPNTGYDDYACSGSNRTKLLEEYAKVLAANNGTIPVSEEDAEGRTSFGLSWNIVPSILESGVNYMRKYRYLVVIEGINDDSNNNNDTDDAVASVTECGFTFVMILLLALN